MLEDKVEKQKPCNCRDKCIVDGKCLLTNVTCKVKSDVNDISEK